MTSLSQTALDFARECLGWDCEADDVLGSDYDQYVSGIEADQMLHFHNLNAVMEAVKRWCRDKLPDFYVLDITYYKPVPEVVDDLYIVTLRTNRTTHEAKSIDLGHALLAACVEAGRKQKVTETSTTA